MHLLLLSLVLAQPPQSDFEPPQNTFAREAAPARPVATPTTGQAALGTLDGWEARKYVQEATGDRAPVPMVVPRDDTPDPSPHPLTALLVGQCGPQGCAPAQAAPSASYGAPASGRAFGRLREARPVRSFLGRFFGRFRGRCG